MFIRNRRAICLVPISVGLLIIGCSKKDDASESSSRVGQGSSSGNSSRGTSDSSTANIPEVKATDLLKELQSVGEDALKKKYGNGQVIVEGNIQFVRISATDAASIRLVGGYNDDTRVDCSVYGESAVGQLAELKKGTTVRLMGSIGSLSGTTEKGHFIQLNWCKVVSVDASTAVADPVLVPELKVLKGHAVEVRDLALSKDGKTLVSCADETLKRDKAIVWNVTKGTPQASIPEEEVGTWEVAVSPDGSTFATSNFSAKLWNATNGQQIVLKDKAEGVFGDCVSFSPDGKTLLVGTKTDAVELWEIASGQKVSSLGKGQQLLSVKAVAYSPDGKLVAGGYYEGHINVWEMPEGKLRHTLKQGQRCVERLTFSPDSQTLASGNEYGIAKLWDMTTGDEVAEFKPSTGGEVRGLAFVPDGSLLLVGNKKGSDSPGQVAFWDVKTHRVRVVLPGDSHAGAAAISGDGKLLAAGEADNSIKVWELNRILQGAGGERGADGSGSPSNSSKRSQP